MSDYSAQIATLLDALGSGEKTIRVDGKETTFRDVSEIKAALAEFRRLQSSAAQSVAQYATTLATFGQD